MMEVSIEQQPTNYPDQLRDVVVGGTFFFSQESEPYMLLGPMEMLKIPIKMDVFATNIKTGMVMTMPLDTPVFIRAFEAKEREW